MSKESPTVCDDSHIEAKRVLIAGEPSKKCAKYKTSSKQRKSLQRAIKWQRWGKYIYWPTENDQMELNLKFKEKPVNDASK